MAKALAEQMEMSDLGTLSFEERLGLMVDREMTEREDRRLTTRLRKAKLRVHACVEDIDFRHKRGLDKSLLMALAACDWIKGRQNLIITGPTGAGKTYLACALVHKACLEGHNALYRRLPNLLRESPWPGEMEVIPKSWPLMPGLISSPWTIGGWTD